jgi:predicted aldo/keto reductase-like oxidoreductase
MSTMQQVEENLAVAARDVALSAADRAAIDKHLERLAGLAKLYCTGCGYCLPCPNEINIPNLFRIYNHAKVYGLWEHGRAAYAQVRKQALTKKRGAPADACKDCGTCEGKCPQGICVRKQLKELHIALSDDAATPK